MIAHSNEKAPVGAKKDGAMGVSTMQPSPSELFVGQNYFDIGPWG